MEIPQGGAKGTFITQGGRFGGYGFYVVKGKPVFTWNLLDLKRIRWEGPELTPGKHTLEFAFKYDGRGAGTLAFNGLSGIGRGGTGMLKVDGRVVAEQKMEHTLLSILQWDENLDVGADTLTGVDDEDYQPLFRFTGKLNQITLAGGGERCSHPHRRERQDGTLAATRTVEKCLAKNVDVSHTVAHNPFSTLSSIGAQEAQTASSGPTRRCAHQEALKTPKMSACGLIP